MADPNARKKRKNTRSPMLGAKRRSPVSKGMADTSILAAVAAEMPGWEVVEGEPPRRNSLEDSKMKADAGPSIARLAKKFLGEDAADSESDAADTFADVDESRKTVKVRPAKGGASKTADFKDGKIEIVQG